MSPQEIIELLRDWEQGRQVDGSNGYRLTPGESKRFRANADGVQVLADKLFLYVPTTQEVTIFLRYNR